MNEMKSLTLNDKKYDCFVDYVARALASASAVIKSASGESVTLSDASDVNLYGLRIFGKTTQDGVPSPEAPADLVSVGSNGSITVDVTSERESKSMTIATPSGLPGIPVSSGGNYTDENGQMWYTDEKDLARGVYIKRCCAETIKTTWDDTNNRNVGVLSKPANPASAVGAGIIILADKLAYHQLAGAEGSKPNGVRISPGDKTSVIACYNGEVITELNVVYPLETPIETPLPAEEIAAYKELHTYREPTTVSNNSGAYMETEYVMDAKKYIDELLAGGIVPATVE